MKIVIALDKFKHGVTATEACEIVRQAVLSVRADAEVVLKPMADGGDGTAAVLQASLGGEWIHQQVTGPLPDRLVRARYLYVADKHLAVVEMAVASGLELLRPEQRDPLRTTTYGTGQLLADAIHRGAQRIVLGVGGSATVDGGAGAAMALGWKFLDAAGQPVGLGGGELERIAKIEPPVCAWPTVEVLCDVDNPLCGEHGAAQVYGPQKGATPAMIERLDAGLAHLGRLVQEQLGKDIIHMPGAGAAGGLSAGAVAFMDARLVPGIDTVMQVSGLKEAVAGADWVITGEGKFDQQSLRGKVVRGVTALARAGGVKVLVLAGTVLLRADEWRAAGIDQTLAINPPGMPLAEAVARTGESLGRVAREWARTNLG